MTRKGFTRGRYDESGIMQILVKDVNSPHSSSFGLLNQKLAHEMRARFCTSLERQILGDIYCNEESLLIHRISAVKYIAVFSYNILEIFDYIDKLQYDT